MLAVLTRRCRRNQYFCVVEKYKQKRRGIQRRCRTKHLKGTVKVLAVDLLRLSTLIIKGARTASLTPTRFDEQPRVFSVVIFIGAGVFPIELLACQVLMICVANWPG